MFKLLLFVSLSGFIFLPLETSARSVTLTDDKVPHPSRWSNSWWIEIEGGEAKADEIARKYGLVNLGKIGSLKDKYTFVKLEGSVAIGSGPIRTLDSTTTYGSINFFDNDPKVKVAVHQELHTLAKKFTPPVSSSDPIWRYQWPVNNSGQTGEQNLLLDSNTVGAWIQGYTGKGILVAVVDDGVESSHVDLRNNYNSANSYDYYDNDNNANPGHSVDSHGTSCAGEIAMVKSNGYCGVGVAYESQLAGIRLLGIDQVVDSQEAGSLSHNRDSIHIYSNSWGPSDNGFTVQGPGPLVEESFMEGSTQGRDGLGNIFTWAAGNGGDDFDSCAADGYVNSIYTIPVGAYNQRGGPAYYDEMCSAKMTVAYVDNTNTLDPDVQVATIITDNECSLGFTGTSAATPYVSGNIALALQANPQLTWRDVQYLIVYTSNSEVLLDNTDDHFTNGAGLTVSHSFGFGAIDAEAMVTRAREWQTVPPQITDMVVPSVNSGEVTFNNHFASSFRYSGSIRFLEHIVVTLTLNATNYSDAVDAEEAHAIYMRFKSGEITQSELAGYIKRGDFQVTLTSPSNTNSTLLFPRPFDTVNIESYYQWPFLSVLHWGEDPRGQWTINVTWTNSNDGIGIVAVGSVQLYGTSSVPDSVASIPDTCSSLCARGCFGPTSTDCDVCISGRVRNASTLECIQPSECVEPYEIGDGYCYIPSSAVGFSPCSYSIIIIMMLVVLAQVWLL